MTTTASDSDDFTDEVRTGYGANITRECWRCDKPALNDEALFCRQHQDQYLHDYDLTNPYTRLRPTADVDVQHIEPNARRGYRNPHGGWD